MSEITSWVKDVFLIILTLTFMEILIPEGSMAKYLRFIFSLIILAVILSRSVILCINRKLFNTFLVRMLCLRNLK